VGTGAESARLRLLLDEMYSPAIAARRRGHDAEAVVARSDLRTRSDPDIFAAAQAERRAVVTENIRDFVPLADERDKRGAGHFGLVLVPEAAFPRRDPRTIGRMVHTLDALARRFPDDDPTGPRLWL
jgi:Domain of unknown function (DUF5615)